MEHPSLTRRKLPDTQVVRETMDLLRGMADKSGRTMEQMVALVNTNFDKSAGRKKKNK